MSEDFQEISLVPPQSEETEIELLRRLRLRDRNAFTKMVQTYNTMLTRTAWLYLGDAHSAEDAVQETLLAAWDAARRKREGTSLRAWLLGILANRCRKHIRTADRRRKRERLVAEGHVASLATNPDSMPLQSVRDAMFRLKNQHREVVVLRFWQGLSVEDTAVALGIPAGTVKGRYHAAVGKLREMMRQK